MWPRICGTATSRPRKSRKTAASDPTKPVRTPSSMKGPRTYQFDAPTSFITSISRRRAKIERRIVLAIRTVDAARRMTTMIPKTTWMPRAIWRIRCETSLP
jgi:hypothetical protein